MPSKGKAKKMSLGEFMGGAPTALSNLPTGPKQRGPDDDGSFQRRRDDRPEREPSRSEQDGNWRRGGGFREGERSSGFGERSGGFRDDRRGGFGDRGGDVGRNAFDRGDRGGGFDRGGRGGLNRGDDRGSFDRDGGRSGFERRGRDFGPDRNGPPLAERPRLQLQPRTAPLPNPPKNEDTPKSRSNPFGNAVPVDVGESTPKQETGKNEAGTPSLKSKEDENQAKGETDSAPLPTETVKEIPEKKHHDPEIVNSRAAAFGDAQGAMADADRGERRGRGGNRGDRNDRGPPPIANSRFAAAAEAHRTNNRDRDDRGPPPIANSRFAAAAEAHRSNNTDRDDRGPPPTANSRFAAAAAIAQEERGYNRDDRGPPPTTNSRFAVAAAMAQEERANGRDDRGPPPTTNSRFAVAAAMAQEERGFSRDERGPPPLANSRFAAAAAMAQEERSFRDDRGPPPTTNSRFAAAAAMAQEERGYGRDRGDREAGGGAPMVQNSRFPAPDADLGERDRGFDDRRRYGDRGGRNDDRFRGRDERGGYDEGRPKQPSPAQAQQPKNSVADILKPKARPLVENILKVPTKEHADNILKPPSKKQNDDSADLSLKAKSQDVIQRPAPPPVEVPKVDDSKVINEFLNGKRLGNDLKAWVADQNVASIENLLFTLLDETEKQNPDVECSWAEPEKYGAALVSMVEDDLLKQVEVLFAIQKYCDKIGMPKYNGEYVIQAMFRSMYKYDLASEDAFDMWKEDESEEHETGKVNAVIQTVDWFSWLEEDEDEDDEYDE